MATKGRKCEFYQVDNIYLRIGRIRIRNRSNNAFESGKPKVMDQSGSGTMLQTSPEKLKPGTCSFSFRSDVYAAIPHHLSCRKKKKTNLPFSSNLIFCMVLFWIFFSNFLLFFRFQSGRLMNFYFIF
jgi:hypothetical protein